MNTVLNPSSKQLGDVAYATALVWFRRDLRLHDHAALAHALQVSAHVHAVFVFDTAILDGLPRADRRVEFIWHSVAALQQDWARVATAAGRTDAAPLWVGHGRAADVIPHLAKALHVQLVVASHDDEPASLARDAKVRGDLAARGIAFHTCKDHVVFERQEVLTQTGRPFTVFTPYKKAWLARLANHPQALAVRSTDSLGAQIAPWAHGASPPQPMPSAALAAVGAKGVEDGVRQIHPSIPSLQSLGFETTNLSQLHIQTGSGGAARLWADFLDRIDHYDHARDYPAVKGVSYLSVHLRFGTVSVRQLAQTAYSLHLQGNKGATTWLSELIWRDFYHQIMANFPHAMVKSFKPDYDRIHWLQGKAAKARFEVWCAGQTGYPLVDAAMAQINQTGYMHNRLRMVVASFLCKDLGVDWRLGEQYFATHLIDFDLAANNGGWQWASSSGCDAQPYFRIFNPTTQSERFDPQGKFIRRYVPQLAKVLDASIHAPDAITRAATGYPAPIVDHAVARAETLARYAVVKSEK